MSLSHLIGWKILCLLLLVVSTVGAEEPSSPSAGSSTVEELSFWEELAFWEAIQNSENPSELEAYLQAYPKGRFAALARLRLQALKQQETEETTTTEETPSDQEQVVEEPPKSEPLPPKPGESFRDCSECPQMVVIPPGQFIMGSADDRSEEKPAHTVTIARAFAIGVYEVTVGEWDACLREGECRHSPKAEQEDQQPISNVSWDDAQEFIRWLSHKTGSEYRLASEAEWEYAARAGTRRRYWWGDEASSNGANCKDCGSQWDNTQAAPVGSFQANPFGLYDVHGNVWEWTADCWNKNYTDAPVDGSAWTRGDCISRVLRGGAWKLDHRYMRASRRSRYDRDVRYYLNGFRVVKTLNIDK